MRSFPVGLSASKEGATRSASRQVNLRHISIYINTLKAGLAITIIQQTFLVPQEIGVGQCGLSEPRNRTGSLRFYPPAGSAGRSDTNLTVTGLLQRFSLRVRAMIVTDLLIGIGVA